MPASPQKKSAERERLDRQRVLEAAVTFADAEGIEALSMRKLAETLGVVPMALYKHVSDKEALLDGVVDLLIAEIPPPPHPLGWREAIWEQILSARRTMLRHPWASRLFETRTSPTPTVLKYMDSILHMFLDGGLTPELTHQAMHTLGSRIWGFTQELFPSSPADAPSDPETLKAFVTAFPHVATVAGAATHSPESVVGTGCDDQFEFEFSLSLLLDGFERLHQTGWNSQINTNPPQ